MGKGPYIGSDAARAPDEPLYPLPSGVHEDYIDCTATTGLTFHVLECGRDDAHPKPLVLLLHGFPEMAYSWRKIMPTIASAGFHVVAVDQRGYGRTTGWDRSAYSDTDLDSFSLRRCAQDIVSLVFALGHRSVHCLVGHDVGSAVTSICALSRPDLFTSCILMSHPYKGFPDPPSVRQLFETNPDQPSKVHRDPDIHASLAKLPDPRKAYKWYNATASAATDWEQPEQGLGPFLRGYFHLKSASWPGNQPSPLKSWTADELAKMPGYYVMPLSASMPQTIAADMTDQDPNATKEWLSDNELAVYVGEWTRTGFQGGLNFYRVATSEFHIREISDQYAGAKIIVPCVFISGDKDWGNYQDPGALENMRHVCTKFYGVKTIHGAGHWPQQEQPGQVVAKILDFIWQAHRKQPMSAPITQTTFSPWSPLGASSQRPSKSAFTTPAIGSSSKANVLRDDTPILPSSKGGPLRNDTPITPSSRSGVRRDDTPIVVDSQDGFYLQHGALGLTSAADSSSRNAEVYRQVAEESQSKLQRNDTPFELDDELNSDDEVRAPQI